MSTEPNTDFFEKHKQILVNDLNIITAPILQLNTDSLQRLVEHFFQQISIFKTNPLQVQLFASNIHQTQLIPLALHLVSFGSTPAGNTVTNNDINIPREKYEQIARGRLIPYLEFLQKISAVIERIRALEKKATCTPIPCGPTSTKDSFEPVLSTTTTNTHTNALTNYTEILGLMEKVQIDILKDVDKLFPDIDVKNMIRCLTWIVQPRENADELVIAPYATCIPETDFHVMYYNIQRSVVSRTLKVVVDNFLCEIPFEVQVPENLDALTVVIIALPIIDKNLEQPVQGIKIMLYQDPLFEVSRGTIHTSTALPVEKLPNSTNETSTNLPCTKIEYMDVEQRSIQGEIPQVLRKNDMVMG